MIKDKNSTSTNEKGDVSGTILDSVASEDIAGIIGLLIKENADVNTTKPQNRNEVK